MTKLKEDEESNWYLLINPLLTIVVILTAAFLLKSSFNWFIVTNFLVPIMSYKLSLSVILAFIPFKILFGKVDMKEYPQSIVCERAVKYSFMLWYLILIEYIFYSIMF